MEPEYLHNGDYLVKCMLTKVNGELRNKIKTRRTLSTKLSRLREYGLINVVPIQVGNRYVSSYIITDKGKRIMRLLEKMS